MELVQETLESPITFPSSRWQHISETAREFVLALTVRDPRSRPSAVEARRHKVKALPFLLVSQSWRRQWLAQKSEEVASPVKKPTLELPEAGDTLQRQPTMKPDDEEHPIVRRLTQRKASS
jgi:serine/threonine protein kinase